MPGAPRGCAGGAGALDLREISSADACGSPLAAVQAHLRARGLQLIRYDLKLYRELGEAGRCGRCGPTAKVFRQFAQSLDHGQ
jgi:hypothetical protein